MKDYSLYEKAYFTDQNFPIQVYRTHIQHRGLSFHSHWHEPIEILYFTEGNALIKCNTIPINAEPGGVIVVNTNELHYGQNLGDSLAYYCIIIDTTLLQSSFIDACEIKYISPISQNLIMFKNNINNDFGAIDCIKSIISEYETKNIGYELSIKSDIYKLLVLLLRNHVEKVLTVKEYDVRVKNLERLGNILKYIHNSYTEKITLDQLSRMSGVSSFHFCHLFKKVTGKTLTEYVNHVRINKAEDLLKNTDMNITEIAMDTGFNDINYFSRLFKKIKKDSPTMFRKKKMAAKL